MSRSERPTSVSAGFTLIEILVVITVIAILAVVVSPMVFRNVGDAKHAAARTQIEILSLALDGFRLDNDRYPTTEEGLHVLRHHPADSLGLTGWRGPYLRKEVPLDPWGRPYIFVSPGEVNPSRFDLSSLGRDGVEGGEDEDQDILSWQ